MLASQISLWGKRGRGEGAGGKLSLLLAVKPSSCFQRGVAHIYAQFGLSLHSFQFCNEWGFDSVLKIVNLLGKICSLGLEGSLKAGKGGART